MPKPTGSTCAERRTEAIRLVVTPVERGIITERARLAGRSVGGLLRDLGLQAVIPPAVTHATIVAVLQTLERYDDVIIELQNLQGLGPHADAQRVEVIRRAEHLQRHMEALVFPR